jgi:hypothetical protein
MEVNGQFHAPSGTHWIGDWVGPTAGLDTEAEKNLLPLPDIKPRPPSPEPVDIPTELFRLNRTE